MPLNPNGFGFNVLDTAQLAPGYVIELVERFDMAQVTIVEATHPKEAFALATALKSRRPHMTVFYRRWRETLRDERLPFQVPTAQEVVNYFRDVFEAGLTACVYNESLVNPMSILGDYSKRMIDLTAPHGWETCHFKVSMGNPGGYAGESLLPKTDPHYRPDGYAESVALWQAAAAANAPRINAGQRPLVWVAPHAYFPLSGLSKGLTDRHREIWRVLDALGINRKYIPLASGETGLIQTDPLDAGKGWVTLTDAVTYAGVFGQVMESQFLPDRVIAHLYALGDKHPGNSEWRNFNLMGVSKFWDTLEDIIKRGNWRVPVWYGDGFNLPAPPPPPPPPVEIPTPQAVEVPVILGTWVEYTVPNVYNLRPKPDITAGLVGQLQTGQKVRLYPVTHATSPNNLAEYYYCQVIGSSPLVHGWASLPYKAPTEPETQPLYDLEFRFKYPALTRAQLESTKEAFAALADFITYAARNPGGTPPEMIVYLDGEVDDD